MAVAPPLLPVRDDEGNVLTDLHAGDEADLDLRADPPCPLALVVLVSPDGVLLGRNRWRGLWELPGGIIEDGETARVAAARELDEETHVAIPADDLAYLGTVTFDLRDPDRRERAAVFGLPVPVMDAAPSFELTEVGWFPAGATPAGTSPIDAAIADWAASRVGGSVA